MPAGADHSGRIASWQYAALDQQLPVDANEDSEVRASREKAAEWLAATEPTGTTQATAYRLLVAVQGKDWAEARQQAIDGLLTRQNEDGGWGQLDDAASDAYATGQVLYVLSLAGVPSNHDAVVRGVSFLVSTQTEDGSRPMTRHSHPGVTPSDFKIPIVYFGSAWATLGLLRSVAN
jgi:squalene cyclase